MGVFRLGLALLEVTSFFITSAYKKLQEKSLGCFGAWINKKMQPHIGPLKGFAKAVEPI